MTGNLSRHVRRIAQFDIVEQMTGKLPAGVVQVSFGLCSTAMIMSTRWLLDLLAPAAGPYVLAYPAILVATLFGRWLSGLTTLVSSAALIWFYILPGGQFSGAVSSADEPRFVVDVVTMFVILAFAEIFRRAIRETNESLVKVEKGARALLTAEAALRQSQRMEAFGNLTGGLAHGFNNLLAGISGNLELLQRRIAEGQAGEAPRYIEAALDAARRAASLTQRLLVFSRHQTLDPKPTDVFALATGMLELIRRIAGPSISVGVIGSSRIWLTIVDPWQLEIALLNLCINAREAMAGSVGRLTIETDNLESSERADDGGDVPQGHYVVIRVSDTGSGMSPEQVARAFDPFFTTKPVGQATGLGLSTVYVFAKQSGGHVRLDSTPGKGTTVHLFLPRDESSKASAERSGAASNSNVGGATILVIDDEPTVRDFMVEVLRDNGYNTRDAGDGPTAMAILSSDADIDLLIVDIGLPGGMNGRQVAEAARHERPDLKVLFATGYAVNVAMNGERLAADVAVITKPFSIADFIDAVAAALKSTTVSQ